MVAGTEFVNSATPPVISKFILAHYTLQDIKNKDFTNKTKHSLTQHLLSIDIIQRSCHLPVFL